MVQIKGHILVIIVLTILLVGYQNCSVYQSEGRKLLESGFFDRKKVDNYCIPFATDEDVQIAMGTQGDLKASLSPSDLSADTHTCTIAVDGAENGLNYMVCVLSEFNRQEVEAALALEYNSEPQEAGNELEPSPPSGTDFLYSTLEENGITYFRTIGVRDNVDRGVSCAFQFSTTEFASKKLEAISTGVTLGERILRNESIIN